MGTDQKEPILRLNGISKQFPGVRALDNVDLSLFPGEVHALMGENGAGKSTLIGIISGLLNPTSGKIFLANEEVTFTSAIQAQKAGISTITQEFNLVPQLTVAENIFLGREPTLRVGLLDWRRIKRHASEVLSELGLNVPLGQRVCYLSVGDRQREADIYRQIPASEKAALSVKNVTVPGFVADVSFGLHVGEVIAFYQYLALGVLLLFALAIDTARRAFIAKSLLSSA